MYQRNQTQKWLQGKTKLETNAKSNTNSFTLNDRQAFENEAIALIDKGWFLSQEQEEVLESTQIFWQTHFTSAVLSKRRHYLAFMSSSIFDPLGFVLPYDSTRSQKLNKHLIEEKTKFAANLKDNVLSSGCYNTVSSSMFAKMDKTAVFF